MRSTAIVFAICALFLVSPAWSFESRAFQLRDDFGIEFLDGCALCYYYYIPCPTYSWFWAISGFDAEDMVGAWFQVGDISMYGFEACDPAECHTLEHFSVVDLYWPVTQYRSLVEFNVYCSDEMGCPVGPSLWRSGTVELRYGWSDISVDPVLSICGCCVDPGEPPAAPRLLITATHLTPDWCDLPIWGFDNISTAVENGCDMHEYGCMPALYPRPHSSHYSGIHSGFYGQEFEYCPPQLFKDPNDTTPDGTQYGYLELLWRIYLGCYGPTVTQPATWGGIKSMYR
jgi:hypothetical protein